MNATSGRRSYPQHQQQGSKTTTMRWWYPGYPLKTASPLSWPELFLEPSESRIEFRGSSRRSRKFATIGRRFVLLLVGDSFFFFFFFFFFLFFSFVSGPWPKRREPKREGKRWQEEEERKERPGPKQRGLDIPVHLIVSSDLRSWHGLSPLSSRSDRKNEENEQRPTSCPCTQRGPEIVLGPLNPVYSKLSAKCCRISFVEHDRVAFASMITRRPSPQTYKLLQPD